MILDKPMKLMVFATANIYKSTGRGSEEVYRRGDDSSVEEGRRQSQMILGQEALIDPATPWRVKWAQRGFLYLDYFQHCVILLVGVVGVLSPKC